MAIVRMSALTYAPLPTWKNLRDALCKKAQPVIELSKPWQRSGDRFFWFSRSSWSLLAIAQWRLRQTGKPSITVWLPDFFCNAALSPLRSIGAQLQFYPINDQMAPDMDACRTMSEETHPDLFVLVHYFGQPTLTESAAVFCQEKNAWLIEDATHVLRPISGIGEYGDCVLYSPHKHIPIPDGALLLVRKNGPGKLADQVSAMATFQDVYLSFQNTPGFSNQSAIIWLFKRVLQRIGIHLWKRNAVSFFKDPETPKHNLGHPKVSQLAIRLLSCQLDSLDAFANRRRQNMILWKEILSGCYLNQTAIGSIVDDVIPYLIGFTFEDEALAEKVFLKWYLNGLPVTTWPDLPPEVKERKDLHLNALLLRNRRIYLPVHQSLMDRQVMNYIRNLQLNECDA